MKEQSSTAFKPIDIREIFAGKNPRLTKMIPGFIFRYIHRIMQLDVINDFLSRNGHLRGIEFVDRVVSEFNVHENIFGIENIPATGRFIFASNHPLGGFDAMLLMKTVYNKLGELKFLTNDVLMNIQHLSSMFVPVNKHGGHSREAAKALAAAYDSNTQILIFPSGLASRKIKGKIVDLEWKKHFITKSIQYQRNIIPVFIGGRNSNRFYRVAKWRKFLHIKWNLEMFFLPDETVKHQNKDVFIYFGKPIPYTSFDKTKTHQQWAEWVKKLVYKIPEKVK